MAAKYPPTATLRRVLLLVFLPLATSLRDGWEIGSVSQPLIADDNTTYLIFVPPKWSASSSHPIMLFLHGVGGINNGDGCRKPGLTTQFPLLDPTYAAKLEHIVIVPVAQQRNWRHHFGSAMALVDMAIAELGGDASRVAIAGQSMGAHGAYLYASELAPGRFCALLVMCAYLDEDGPIGDTVPSKVLEPLKSVPLWIFHSEVDDATPPPGRPQDDSKVVAAAFEAIGNPDVKHTRYPADQKGPNYIPGHAAFELAFHDDGLWAWLKNKRRPQPIRPTPEVLAAAGVVLVLVLIFACATLPRLAFLVSSLALLLSSVAYLGLQQSEGGLLDSCYSYSFVGVSFEQCRAIGASIAKAGLAESGWLMLSISKGRAENCFALGMGAGSVYALLFLAKGTKEVAVVHLMHAVWAISVCLANAQNAGLLPFPIASAEANISFASQEQLRPFVAVTGVQALLGVYAFLLSRGIEPASASSSATPRRGMKAPPKAKRG